MVNSLLSLIRRITPCGVGVFVDESHYGGQFDANGDGCVGAFGRDIIRSFNRGGVWYNASI